MKFIIHASQALKHPTPLGISFAVLGLFLPIIPIFNTQALVPFIAVCAVGALIIVCKREGQWLRYNTDRWMLSLILGCVLTVSSFVFVSEFAPSKVISVFKLLGVVLIGLSLMALQKRLSSDDITFVAVAMMVGFLFALLWLLIDGLTGGIISHFVFKYRLDHSTGQFWLKSASSVLVLASLLLGIFLVKTNAYISATIFALSASFAAYSIQSRSAAFGVLISIFLGCLYQILGKARKVIISFAIVIAFLLPAWITISGITPEDISPHLEKNQSSSYSIVYRTYIWSFTTEHILQKPLLGWGVGASKQIGTDKAGVVVDPIFGSFGEPIPLHPHNSILQIWLEFGLLGAIFACGIIIRSIYLLDKITDTPFERIWSFSLFMMLMCFFNFNYSIASSWWMVTVVTIVSFLVAFTRCDLTARSNALHSRS